MKVGLPLIKNTFQPLDSSVLIPLRLADKMFGGTTRLVILNEGIKDSMKIVKSLEDSGLLINGVIQKRENERKEQKARILGMLLGHLCVSSLGNMLVGKEAIETSLRDKEQLQQNMSFSVAPSFN